MDNWKSQCLAVLLVLGGIPCGLAQAADVNASELLRAEDFSRLNQYYATIQQEFNSGRISGDQLRNEFRVFYPTDKDLAAKYDAWVTAFPRSYVARLARGIYFKRVGFEARGDRYFSETDKSRIDAMDAAFKLA